MPPYRMTLPKRLALYGELDLVAKINALPSPFANFIPTPFANFDPNDPQLDGIDDPTPGGRLDPTLEGKDDVFYDRTTCEPDMLSSMDIVEEWVPQPAWGRSEEAKRMIRMTAEANNIEKPTGYIVSFHYNSGVENFHFGKTHPMKPWRLQLAKQLVLSYGLQYAMDLYKSPHATKDEILTFHDEDYLDFLETVTPLNKETAAMKGRVKTFNFGEDCPVFNGMWEYCTYYTGATLDAVRALISRQSDIALNWSGGLHHAKKKAASGFCYVNDIVLAIQQLLLHFPRVLYIDIDVHHGDGVEQAFSSSDRVLTLSYHKYSPEDFFPGTGGAHEIGPDRPNPGAHYSLNVPLQDGIEDDQYIDLFRDTVGATMHAFDPPVVVLQCGADSLGGDRLGRFNLNIKAHGDCVAFVKSFRRPLLILGGGGYTPRNVARTWCHETSLCVGATLADELPAHVPYRQAFEGEDNGGGRLYPSLSDIEGKRHANQHTADDILGLKRNIHTQLRYLQGAPSVQMQRLPRGYAELRQAMEERDRDEAEDRHPDGIDSSRRDLEMNWGGRMEHRWI